MSINHSLNSDKNQDLQNIQLFKKQDIKQLNQVHINNQGYFRWENQEERIKKNVISHKKKIYLIILILTLFALIIPILSVKIRKLHQQLQNHNQQLTQKLQTITLIHKNIQSISTNIQLQNKKVNKQKSQINSLESVITNKTFYNKALAYAINYSLQYGSLQQINTIDLSKQIITKQSLIGLSQLEFPNLQHLIFNNSNINDEILHEFYRFNSVDFIKYLDLQNNFIISQGLQSLSVLKQSPLYTLKLANNQLSDQGIRVLSLLPFPYLQYLTLDNNNIGDSGFLYLNDMPYLFKLKYLSASGNQLSFWNVETFSNGFFGLSTLILNKNPINRGIISLAQWKLDSLRQLQLNQIQLDDEGAKQFCKIKFRSLRQLSLKDNKIQNLTCLKTKNLRLLQSLVLTNNKLNQDTIQYLNQEFIDVDITY